MKDSRRIKYVPLSNGLKVNKNGLICDENPISENNCFDEVSFKRLHLIMDYIEKVMVPTKSYPKSFMSSSYGMKHVCEESIGQYITNGEFILAMDIMGIEMMAHCGSLNAVFKFHKTKYYKNIDLHYPKVG